VVVHRKLAGFEHRSSLRTWIYGIALRCASSYRRSATRREIASERPDDKVIALQVQNVQLRQARELLDMILDSLDERKREVFVLYELEELPMHEVAKIVGCPLQTAYSRLHAARRAVERGAERMQAREQVR
jgi:RNA polymerase sigma-70 factor (ECF subfamily)